MPATRRLIDLINKAQPLIQKALPLAKQAQPLIDEAKPLVTEALPLIQQFSVEIENIAPALQAVLAVVERHMAAGKSKNDSLAAIEKYLSGLVPGHH